MVEAKNVITFLMIIPLSATIYFGIWWLVTQMAMNSQFTSNLLIVLLALRAFIPWAP